MKKPFSLFFFVLLVAVACDKDDDNETWIQNSGNISTELQKALEGKSLAVIYTYQGTELWESYFDPEHQLTDDFIIINGTTYLCLKYLEAFSVKVFNPTPITVYELHLYFPLK